MEHEPFEITRLLADYWLLLDARDSAGWLDLFQDTATLSFGGTTLQGRQELAGVPALWEGIEPGTHILANPSIRVAGERSDATSNVVFVSGRGTPTIQYTGRCVDRIELTSSGWKFSRREISFLLGRHGPPGSDA